MSRFYYRCKECLTPLAMDAPARMANLPLCACDGTLEFMGVVRRHRVVRLEDRPPCDGRCTGAIGPSCDCQCGGENHGSGRLVTVVAADLGPARIVAVDSDVRIARANEYRITVSALDAAIRACSIAWAFEARRIGAYVDSRSAYAETVHVYERRAHARSLKSHNGRLRALQSLTDYVRTL